jgi:Tol biopolymer transport system component
VTKKGGDTPVVSPDGRSVYYAKEDTIWRVPAEGGEEMPVLRDYPRRGRSHWAPVDNGIYFAQWEETGGSFKFFNFETGQATQVMPLEERWTVSAPAISPDGRWFLAAQIDQRGQDIMLVENFR